MLNKGGKWKGLRKDAMPQQWGLRAGLWGLESPWSTLCVTLSKLRDPTEPRFLPW